MLATVNRAGYPCWSKDSASVYFLLSGSGNTDVKRVKVADRKIEQVSTIDFHQTGYYGFWLGLTPADSPIILKDTGTEEIIALDWHAP